MGGGYYWLLTHEQGVQMARGQVQRPEVRPVLSMENELWTHGIMQEHFHGNNIIGCTSQMKRCLSSMISDEYLGVVLQENFNNRRLTSVDSLV